MPKRHVNWKLLAWLVGATIVSGGAVRLVHGAQMNRHARTMLAQASEAEAVGKLDQMIVYLKRYLTINGSDTSALERYGFALDKTSSSDVERTRAVNVMEKVLAQDHKRDAVRRRIIELYLELQWYPDARRHAEILAGTSPDDAEVLVLLGRCYEADREPSKARNSYEKAIEKEPHRIEGYVRLANLLRSLQFDVKADEAMEALVKNNDKDAAAYLERALYRLRGGLLKEADTDLAEARQLAPENVRVLLASADLAQRRGNAAEALAWWKRGVELHGDNLVLIAGLAALDIQQAKPEEAVRLLKAALERYPSDPELNYLLTAAYLEQNDVAAVEGIIKKLRINGSQASLANFLAALLMLHQHRPLDAAQTLEETLQSSVLSLGLAAHICNCLGQACEQCGNNDRALAAYRKAVELAPELVRARVRLGALLLATGATDAALEQLSIATRLPLPPDDAWTLYARALLQHTLTLPDSRRHWGKVAAALDKAGANKNQVVPVARLRVDELMARNQAAEADRLLEKLCSEHPKQAALWAERARLAARAGEFKRAAAVLDEARSKAGDQLELRLATLECWPGAEGAAAQDFLRAQEAAAEKLAPAERTRIEAMLAATQYLFGNVTQGDRLCRRLLHDLQDGRRVNFSEWVQLLDLALQGKDDGLIDDVAQALKKLEGEDTGAWWRYTEAAHHIVKVRHGNRSGLDAARTILEKVANLRPGWGRAALLQAHLNGVAGNAAGELDGYQRAFDLGERQLPTVQRLVQMLAERGRFVEADEVLRKAQQNLILRGDFARTAAEIALHVRNFERAVVLARLYVPEGVTDPARMLWLGQLYVDAGHPQEAEAHFRAVIDQAFDAERKVLRYDPLEGWLRLVALLVRDKRPQDAEAVIEKMRQQLPAEQLPLALGDCFEKLGKLAQAETQYRAGLDLRRNQPLLQPRLAQLYIRMDQAEKAVPLLMRLLGPEENRAWAQRQLALVLADRGGDENYKAALALLEENRKNGRGSIADERAGSFVQATRPENRAAALKALETSLAAQPLDPDEQFRLARLYEAAESDWPRVRDLMGELVKKDPTNPEYLAHHIGNLLKHGNQNEALALVERLAQLEPESERVRRFREDRK